MIIATLLALQLLGNLGPLPEIRAVERDGRGCARLELRQGDRVAALATAPGLCVKNAYSALLERDFVNAVLLVNLPRDPTRLTIFIYRLEGSRLTPRFLGSGLHDFLIIDSRRIPAKPLDRLVLDLLDEQGNRRSTTCFFRKFPLACEPVGPAAGGCEGSELPAICR